MRHPSSKPTKKDRFVLVGKTSKPAKINLSFLVGALQEIPLQPQALLGGGARELAVLNAAQAQQAVG